MNVALSAVAAATAEQPPCSAASVAMMQDVQARFSYVGGIARLTSAGSRILCSTLGPAAEGLRLGPAEHVSAAGVTVRREVALPRLQGTLPRADV